jgi:hypothetical protein
MKLLTNLTNEHTVTTILHSTLFRYRTCLMLPTPNSILSNLVRQGISIEAVHPLPKPHQTFIHQDQRHRRTRIITTHLTLLRPTGTRQHQDQDQVWYNRLYMVTQVVDLLPHSIRLHLVCIIIIRITSAGQVAEDLEAVEGIITGEAGFVVTRYIIPMNLRSRRCCDLLIYRPNRCCHRGDRLTGRSLEGDIAEVVG